MKCVIISFIITLLFSGCCAPNQIMVNPMDGTTIDCSTYGWGWAGTPMALMNHYRCIERYEGIGYVKSQNYKGKAK